MYRGFAHAEAGGGGADCRACFDDVKGKISGALVDILSHTQPPR